MSNAAESNASTDTLKTLAEVIASNDPTSSDTNAATRPSQPISVGSLLREEREKLNLSASDIATKLRMGLKQVIALETSDYAALPTGTFLRGFVRNYAKAVSLNADEVLALLEKTHSAAAAVKASSVVVPSQQNIRVPAPGGDLASPNRRIFFVGIVVLLLLAAGWYWWEYVFPFRGDGGRTKAAVSQPVTLPPPVAPGEQSIPVTPPATDSPATTEGSAGNSGTTTQSVAEEKMPLAPQASPPKSNLTTSTDGVAPIQRQVQPAGSATLGFTFSGDSWVEVIDGNGKTILSRRFAAGDAEEVVGRAPLSVVVGNSKSTRMALNGREFDLEPHVRGAVARMSVK